MKPITRRAFVMKSAVAVGAGVLAARGLRPSTWAAPVGANDAIRIGVIGLGGKGAQHMRLLAKRPDTRVVAICDLDPAALARAKKEFEGQQVEPFATTEPRELLARAEVDAVFVVTGNHWHALLSVWACQAGKDVYVEKPMTHTVWEGRKLIEAAAKYRRVVQVGTQYRSESGLAEGIKWLHAGGLGKLKYVHAPYYGRRGSIGRRHPWYPGGLNYDLFCGPTPVVPLERDKLHYDWHWSWTTGNGELGNNGVHLLDVARRIVRSEAPPRRVLGLGGRFVIDDCAETPNAQLAVYDYPEAPVIFEARGLPAKPDVNYSDQINGTRVGVVAHCEGGYLAGLTGCAAYDPSGKVIQKFGGDGGGLTHRIWPHRPRLGTGRRGCATSATSRCASARPRRPRRSNRRSRRFRRRWRWRVRSPRTSVCTASIWRSSGSRSGRGWTSSPAATASRNSTPATRPRSPARATCCTKRNVRRM
jgi:predicted dehydrogenase